MDERKEISSLVKVVETLYSLELSGLWPSSFGSPCPGKCWENCVFSLLLNPAPSPLLFCQGISQSSLASSLLQAILFLKLLLTHKIAESVLSERTKIDEGSPGVGTKNSLTCTLSGTGACYQRKRSWGCSLYCEHSISQINSPSQHDTEHFCFPAKKLVQFMFVEGIYCWDHCMKIDMRKEKEQKQRKILYCTQSLPTVTQL